MAPGTPKDKDKDKEWNPEMIDELISAVSATPALWDKTHRDHKNSYQMSKYWESVGIRVGVDSKYKLISFILTRCICPRPARTMNFNVRKMIAF